MRHDVDHAVILASEQRVNGAADIAGRNRPGRNRHRSKENNELVVTADLSLGIKYANSPSVE